MAAETTGPATKGRRSGMRIGVALAIALPLAASAASADEGSRVVDPDRKVEGARFAADATTRRVWVDATVARRFASGKEARRPGEHVPVLVRGLSFDPATRAIVYSDGAKQITCAELVRDQVTPTGACRIVATIEPRSIDTGFGSAVRDHLVVRIVPSS